VNTTGNRVPGVLYRLQGSCSIIQIPLDGDNLGVGRQPSATLNVVSSYFSDIQDGTHLLNRNPGSIGRPLEMLDIVYSVKEKDSCGDDVRADGEGIGRCKMLIGAFGMIKTELDVISSKVSLGESRPSEGGSNSKNSRQEHIEIVV
jgi:hypothetical protein